MLNSWMTADKAKYILPMPNTRRYHANILQINKDVQSWNINLKTDFQGRHHQQFHTVSTNLFIFSHPVPVLQIDIWIRHPWPCCKRKSNYQQPEILLHQQSTSWPFSTSIIVHRSILEVWSVEIPRRPWGLRVGKKWRLLPHRRPRSNTRTMWDWQI